MTSIERKTKAKMFENLKVGDKVLFSVPIKYAGSNRGTYATYIEIQNINTREKTQSSFNQLPTILKAFTFTEDRNWYKCNHCDHEYLVYGCESACSLNYKCEFKERKNVSE